MQKYELPTETEMYMEVNGFLKSEGRVTSFFKGDKIVMINGDAIEFISLTGEECKVLCRFHGTAVSGIFEWMLIFHVFGFISLKNLAKDANHDRSFDWLFGAIPVNQVPTLSRNL